MTQKNKGSNFRCSLYPLPVLARRLSGKHTLRRRFGARGLGEGILYTPCHDCKEFE